MNKDKNRFTHKDGKTISPYPVYPNEIRDEESSKGAFSRKQETKEELYVYVPVSVNNDNDLPKTGEYHGFYNGEQCTVVVQGGKIVRVSFSNGARKSGDWNDGFKDKGRHKIEYLKKVPLSSLQQGAIQMKCVLGGGCLCYEQYGSEKYSCTHYKAQPAQQEPKDTMIIITQSEDEAYEVQNTLRGEKDAEKENIGFWGDKTMNYNSEWHWLWDGVKKELSGSSGHNSLKHLQSRYPFIPTYSFKGFKYKLLNQSEKDERSVATMLHSSTSAKEQKEAQHQKSEAGEKE